MNCDLCGDEVVRYWEAGKQKVCDWCKDKLTENIGMKCLNCGAYGFVPLNEANLNRVMFFIPLTQAQIMQGNLVVVNARCPHCGGMELCRDAVQSVLGS